MMRYGVLYVDDEINNLNSFKAAFRNDFAIYTAASGVEGRAILEEHEIGVIITDQRMPEMTGIEFLESILTAHPDTIRILLTGFADVNVVNNAINRGQIYKYLVKPWQAEDIKMDIRNGLEIYNLRKENKMLIYELKEANSKLDIILKSED